MFDAFTLTNGLRVVAEPIPHYRSVSVGLWVGAGSMYETPAENGLSHFLEHMLFKGTERRTARGIAEAMDAIGGQLNAFTSKECTCFYAKVMDNHLPIALDVLSDLLLHATLDPAELEKERGVILEEISMVEDTPEDLAHELLGQIALSESPLAKPILGTSDLIAAYTRADLARFRQTHYRPDNTVLAVAGRYDLSALRALAEQCLGGWEKVNPPENPAWQSCFTPSITRRGKDIEQIHLCVGFPGVPTGDPDLYPLAVFNNLFGGGMSSRLFQRIREERGMAYSVYSYPSSYPGCGLYTLYAGTSLSHTDAVLDMLREEIARVLEGEISEKEFDMARAQLRSGFILGQESTSGRMNGIGRSELLLRRVREDDEILQKIDAVTLADATRVARRLLSGENAATVVGKAADTIDEKRLLWR